MYLHLQREYKIMKLTQGHANIVQGVDYIQERFRSRGYLVMERIYGESIMNHVVEQGPYSEAESKNILRQLLNAVDFMHEKQVIHRDLNPTNVFQEKDGNVKLLDFNISKIIEKEHEFVKENEDNKYRYSMFTKTGTPLYSAPEILT